MTRGTETKFDINDVDRKFINERRGMKLVKPIRQNPRRKTLRIGVADDLFVGARELGGKVPIAAGSIWLSDAEKVTATARSLHLSS